MMAVCRSSLLINVIFSAIHHFYSSIEQLCIPVNMSLSPRKRLHMELDLNDLNLSTKPPQCNLLPSQLPMSVIVLDAICWMDTPWADIKRSTFGSCFKACDFTTIEIDTATEEDIKDDLPLSLFITR